MKRFLFLGILIVLISIAPLAIKSFVDEKIDKQIDLLKGNGIELNILNSKGYVNTKRDFELTIYNVEEFKYFLNILLSEKYPSYKSFITDILNKKNENIDEFLEGIVFKGNISNSNIDYNADIKANIYLHEFSENIMQNIKNNKDSKAFFIPFLQKKGLSLDLLFSNELKLEKLTLKDIDEIIFSTSNIGLKTNTKIKVLAYEIKNKSDNKSIKAEIDLKRFYLDIDSINKANIDLNNLSYKVDYVNKLVNSSILQFKTFNFNIDDVLLNIKNMFIDMKGKKDENLYSTSLLLKSDNISFISQDLKSMLKDLKLELYLKDLDYKSLESLNSSFLKMEKIRQSKEDFDKLVSNLNLLINNGAFLHSKISIDSFDNPELKLALFNMDIDLILNKNSINLTNINQQMILKHIDGQIKIKLQKNDFEHILNSIEPNLALLISLYAKEEREKILFNITISKGKIDINGKKLN